MLHFKALFGTEMRWTFRGVFFFLAQNNVYTTIKYLLIKIACGVHLSPMHRLLTGEAQKNFFYSIKYNIYKTFGILFF